MAINVQTPNNQTISLKDKELTVGGEVQVKNSDESFDNTYTPDDSPVTLPDITFTDSDGSITSVPSLTDIEATPCSTIPSITISLDDDTPYFNQEILITATPSGGYSPTLYTFIATNGTYNEVIQVGASNTANWNVRLAGNVSIIVQATDGSSEVYTSTSIDIEGFIFSLMPWAGSNTFDIAIPTSSAGTYNCTLNVAAEDGTLISNNAITTWNDVNWTQTMPTSGRVYVQITGTFSRIDTSNDWQDILEEVYQWNDVTIGQSDWMSGGNIRRVSATDAPDLTLAANRMRNMFASSKITHLNVSAWDLSIINDLFQFAAFTQVEIVGLTQFWSTFTGGSLFRAFRQMPPQDYHLRDITWTNVNNGGGFLQSSDGTTLEDYEQALININADAPTTSFTIDAGGSQYRSGSAAETAKNDAITNYGITFIDGGAV